MADDEKKPRGGAPNADDAVNRLAETLIAAFRPGQPTGPPHDPPTNTTIRGGKYRKNGHLFNAEGLLIDEDGRIIDPVYNRQFMGQVGGPPPLPVAPPQPGGLRNG